MATLNPQSLVTLWQIEQYGSFSATAKATGWSQPAISQQIQSLEKELGFSLFARSTKGVELTPAGRQYYQDVSGVLAALQRADRHASAIAHGQAGTLDIGGARNGHRLS